MIATIIPKIKRSEVGYNLQEKHVGLFGNNSIDIIKFKGKALNKKYNWKQKVLEIKFPINVMNMFQ